MTLLLAFRTPYGTREFGLALVALCGLVGMEVVYWIVIHPVNKVWVHDLPLSSAASGFFAFGRRNSEREARAADWTDLRDRWEYAHAFRACLALASFVALVLMCDGGCEGSR